MYEGNEPTNYPSDHVRRRRNAVMAGVPRGPSQSNSCPCSGPRSTFQETLLRVSDETLFERPIVITNNAYRFMVVEQLVGDRAEGRRAAGADAPGQGPAIAAGAAFAQTRDSEAIVLALAADHVVRDTTAFVAACREGLAAAEAGRIVTFGVRARAGRHRIRLYLPGRRHFRRGPRRREIRREAGCGHRRRLHQVGLSLEQRQLHVPRRDLLDEYRNSMPRACGRLRCGRQGRPRPRIRQARRGRVRLGESDLDRLCGDGKDLACRRGAGVVRLVRCRLLARGVGIVRQGQPGQRGAGRRRVRGFAQLQRLDRPRAGRARRRRRSRGGGNPGRRAGVAAEGRQRAEAAGRPSSRALRPK